MNSYGIVRNAHASAPISTPSAVASGHSIRKTINFTIKGHPRHSQNNPKGEQKPNRVGTKNRITGVKSISSNNLKIVKQ